MSSIIQERKKVGNCSETNWGIKLKIDKRDLQEAYGKTVSQSLS
jgi:hypothetical protein